MSIPTIPIAQKLRNLFSIDVRSLALFRIVISLLLLAELSVRLCDLKVFYSDAGVLPRSALLREAANPAWFSLNLINGTALCQGLLFLFLFACACSLLIGYRTRLMTFLSWVLLVSLQNRNPLIFNRGGDLLRMLFFWGMFLPLESYAALDGFKKKFPRTSFSFFSAATVAILCQFVFLYVFSALAKTGNSWRIDGTAIYYTLNIEYTATSLGQKILSLPPEILKGLTFSVLYTEFFGPFLLFIPWFTGPIRIFIFFIFLLLQVGFSAFLYIGLFPIVCVAASLVFLPADFWEAMAKISFFKAPLKFFSDGASWLAEKFKIGISGRAGDGIERPVNLLVLFFLLYIFFWNLAGVPKTKFIFPRTLKPIGHFLRIEQDWSMFAKNPVRYDGWFVFNGKLAGGQFWDVWRDEPVNWAKPDKRGRYFKNYQWQRYLLNVKRKKNLPLRFNLGSYLCRNWNQDHSGDKHLNEMWIYFMREKTRLNFKKSKPKKIMLWHHRCAA